MKPEDKLEAELEIERAKIQAYMKAGWEECRDTIAKAFIAMPSVAKLVRAFEFPERKS